MIPVKIISINEARAKGLISSKSFSGTENMGAIIIAKKNPIGPDEIMEKYIMNSNNELELKFMHKNRMKYLKSKKDNFEKYMNQFKTVNGIDKDKYIKDNKLILEDKEIK